MGKIAERPWQTIGRLAVIVIGAGLFEFNALDDYAQGSVAWCVTDLALGSVGLTLAIRDTVNSFWRKKRE